MRAYACAQGQRILELGCGCGLVGLVFAALGARVLLTDLAETQARSGPCILSLQSCGLPYAGLCSRRWDVASAWHSTEYMQHRAHSRLLPRSQHVPGVTHDSSAVRRTPCCASQPWWVCQALIQRNVALNATAIAAGGGSAAAAVLAWGVTDPSALPGAWSAPDLVIAADVVYHRELFHPLLATLAAFGAPGGSRVSGF